jgi:hypothetical protein
MLELNLSGCGRAGSHTSTDFYLDATPHTILSHSERYNSVQLHFALYNERLEREISTIVTFLSLPCLEPAFLRSRVGVCKVSPRICIRELEAELSKGGFEERGFFSKKR